VKVNGKRVLTVDTHSHCCFHEAINPMGDGADKLLAPVKGIQEHFIVIEQRLKEMDAMAIDMEVLSINPFWYGKDRDTAGAIARLATKSFFRGELGRLRNKLLAPIVRRQSLLLCASALGRCLPHEDLLAEVSSAPINRP
jgi:hypothetical protein